MERFADLLDRITYTRSRNGKIALIADYLRTVPDPDRGWGLAAMTGDLDFALVKPALVKALVDERIDPELFAISRHYVGDLAETVSLIWPAPHAPERYHAPHLGEAVEKLRTTGKSAMPGYLSGLLDTLDASGRYALIKLATGALRMGVSARLAKTAFAQAFSVDVGQVEEAWHALEPPFLDLFAWAEGRGPFPGGVRRPVFRPFMLAHPLGNDASLDLADYAAEWKWDGIRVQIVRVGEEVRLFSRTGDDISASFPEIGPAMGREGVLDGELLVRGNAQADSAGSFNALQQRLGRKKVTAKMLGETPAFVRLYDILFDGDEDLREHPWHVRRSRLESFAAPLSDSHFDISPLIKAEDFAALAEIRAGARDAAIEGVMLKRRDSAYLAGRRVGYWYKWKRDPLTADCVMMYAQRGHGKRSSFYSDYTFGCWSETGELLPVGKAYSGFTDEELKWLDSFVRNHSVARFGPVREVEKSLVLEVAFDSIHRSTRHKSGLAMRFPRIARIRRDKPAAEADSIATLQEMIAD
ncbi:MAG: cisplatin damage response ATP-dependent DNA ligase [Sphingobium sp.]